MPPSVSPGPRGHPCSSPDSARYPETHRTRSTIPGRESCYGVGAEDHAVARRDLLLDICACPNVKAARASESHPCAEVVSSQNVRLLTDFQVPTPWIGQLRSAKVLFVSSNPSISDTEHHPTWSKSDGVMVDYFENHFGGGRREWTEDGMRTLQLDGSYEANRFYSSVKNRAAELLDDPEPGSDYVLTAAVRCKSRNECGVSDALDECSSAYLRKTIEASGAVIIVVLGDHARYAVCRLFGVLRGDDRLSGPLKIGQRERHFAWLPHPANRSKLRKFSNCFTPDEVSRLRALIARYPSHAHAADRT